MRTVWPCAPAEVGTSMVAEVLLLTWWATTWILDVDMMVLRWKIKGRSHSMTTFALWICTEEYINFKKIIPYHSSIRLKKTQKTCLLTPNFMMQNKNQGREHMLNHQITQIGNKIDACYWVLALNLDKWTRNKWATRVLQAHGISQANSWWKQGWTWLSGRWMGSKIRLQMACWPSILCT